MTGSTPVASLPPGSWRLVDPPADVTAAVDAIRSACSGWKPVFVNVPTAAMGTREEGICNAVQDWSSWSMDRASVDLLLALTTGVFAGLLLYPFLALSFRSFGSILKWVTFSVAARIQRIGWSTRRPFGRQGR